MTIYDLHEESKRRKAAEAKVAELETRIAAAMEFSRQAKHDDLVLCEMMHALVGADESEVAEWAREMWKAIADGEEG